MENEDKRKIAILLAALAAARGTLYEVYNGDAGKEEVGRILEGTSEQVLQEILGKEEHRSITDLWDIVTAEEKMKLMGLGDSQS